ncbi:unnamed protein product [Lymnaea stagnalis]|uniref:TIR domain-containing protein n=1 Tax=Lymnaea stagnalis TaxID=6523 RepID=A0AAV2H2Z5_LYMST
MGSAASTSVASASTKQPTQLSARNIKYSQSKNSSTAMTQNKHDDLEARKMFIQPTDSEDETVSNELELVENKEIKKVTTAQNLEDFMKKLSLSHDDLEKSSMILKENKPLFKHLKCAVAAVLGLKDTEAQACMNSLLNLDSVFFKLSIKERSQFGDFMSFIGFCKESFIRYKNILNSNGFEYIDDQIFGGETSVEGSDRQILYSIRTCWWNFSDSSNNFGVRLAEEGIIQESTQDLSKLIGADGKDLKNSFTFESSFGVLHNVARNDNLRQLFRDNKVVDVAAKFLCYDDLPKVTMLALMTLALIIDENQTDLMMSHESAFDLILLTINSAWEKKDHRHDGFSVQELLVSLSKLSRNDKVKRMLVEKNVLNLVIAVLSDGNPEEIEWAAKLLWELSFDALNKTKIQENEALMKLVSDLSKHLNNAIAKAAQGVLLVTGMDKNKSESERKCFIYQTNSSDKKIAKTGGHIMISYNWGSKQKMIMIRNVLQERGYKTWMDIDFMAGSSLQAMAEAVELAEVILICMSEQYKESSNCRSEAEYAFFLKKPMIPLIMQEKYKPDGWLGILLGSKIFYDFSGKYSFDDKIEDLIREIGDRGTKTDNCDECDSAVVSLVAPLAGKPPTSKPTAVLNTKIWMEENNLSQISCLSKLSSEHLLYLRKLSVHAPEFYHVFLKDFLSGKESIERLNSIMMVSGAIEKLPR